MTTLVRVVGVLRLFREYPMFEIFESDALDPSEAKWLARGVLHLYDFVYIVPHGRRLGILTPDRLEIP